MRTFTLSSVLLAVLLSAISLNSYADAQTTVSIKKITTLSGSDADRFKKTFGPMVSASNPVSTIQCGKKSCVVSTSRSGFSGELARHLLNGRKEVVFSSENKKFKLQCGEAKVPFCNVTQDDAVLK